MMQRNQGEMGVDYLDVKVSQIAIRLRFEKNWDHIIPEHVVKRKEPWIRLLSEDIVKDLKIKNKKSGRKRDLKAALLEELCQAFDRAMLVVYDVEDVKSGDVIVNIEMLGPSGISAFCRSKQITALDSVKPRELYKISTAHFKVSGKKFDRGDPLWLKVVKKRLHQLAPAGKVLPKIHKELDRKERLREEFHRNFEFLDLNNWGLINDKLTGGALPAWPEAEKYYSAKTKQPEPFGPTTPQSKTGRRKTKR